MISVSSDLLQAWINGLLWPLTRVLGVLAIAPVFSSRGIPNQVKIGLGILLTLIIAPMLPSLPAINIFSAQGLLILVEQLVIGLSIGFCVRIIFAAVDMAGQVAGMTMGLGFASFYDPQTQGQTTSLNQFFVLLATLVFLAMNGHLMLIQGIADSFVSFPIAADPARQVNALVIVQWGGKIFSAGLLLALPVTAALLITNMALGILTRTAPQLNLFGIGFPITLGMGFLMIAWTLPDMLPPLQRLIEETLALLPSVVT